MSRKKITRETLTHTIDHHSGEVLGERRTQESMIEREPDYIKLYIQDLLSISGLSKSNNAVLLALLRQMNYNNQMVLIASVKRAIALELGIQLVTVNKAIEAFQREGILIRQDRGVYIANPYLFGRGKWEDIRQIRLTVQYSATGRKMSAEIEAEPQLALFKAS